MQLGPRRQPRERFAWVEERISLSLAGNILLPVDSSDRRLAGVAVRLANPPGVDGVECQALAQDIGCLQVAILDAHAAVEHREVPASAIAPSPA